MFHKFYSCHAARARNGQQGEQKHTLLNLFINLTQLIQERLPNKPIDVFPPHQKAMVAAVRDIRSSFPHMGGIHAQDDDDEMYDEAGRVSFRTSGQEERAQLLNQVKFCAACLSVNFTAVMVDCKKTRPQEITQKCIGFSHPAVVQYIC